MMEESHRDHRGGTEDNEAINRLTDQVIGAAIEVHRELGPGLLESAYQRALAYEMTLCGIAYKQQLSCPVRYKGLTIEDAYRLDFLVSERVVVELKTVDALEDVHTAQLLTYMKFSNCRIGLLMNFRAISLVKSLRRLAL